MELAPQGRYVAFIADRKVIRCHPEAWCLVKGFVLERRKLSGDIDHTLRKPLSFRFRGAKEHDAKSYPRFLYT